MKEKMYCYEYPRPALSADCIVFGYDGKEIFILLIERGFEPYKGYWSFPGGFMDIDETIERCVAREMEEETNLSRLEYRQFYTTSKVDRDPRGRVVSVVFYTLVKLSDITPVAGDDAKNVQWHKIDELPQMGFDHNDVFQKGINHFKMELEYSIYKNKEQFFSFDPIAQKEVYNTLIRKYSHI